MRLKGKELPFDHLAQIINKVHFKTASMFTVEQENPVFNVEHQLTRYPWEVEEHIFVINAKSDSIITIVIIFQTLMNSR